MFKPKNENGGRLCLFHSTTGNNRKNDNYHIFIVYFSLLTTYGSFWIF